MTKLTMPTADAIVAAAKARGMSISALCRAANIDQNAIYKWRSAGVIPSGRIIQKMLNVLNEGDVP